MSSIQPIINTLEALFAHLDATLFNHELTDNHPVITVSPDTTKGAYGWCSSVPIWKNTEDGEFYEINLTSETIARPFEDVAETLLHEMVHLHNAVNGVKDCSRGGTYHNTKFKTAGEEHGLIVSKMDKYGWAKTELTDETRSMLIDWMIANDLTAFDVYRMGFGKSKGKSKKSSIKHTCPECLNVARTTKVMNLMCGDCEIHMVAELPDTDN